ncbi:hypothetical protein [Dawidia soli]|uniref:Uncharacterized protein n=1 Tax=Dawidia soli TaxID=2782352 RepID=A0AAP2GFM0_9BACT|nr:hypothetical protein [Dawidia soli]MBT1689599.1 hypothetical protein [Dawidia soli]
MTYEEFTASLEDSAPSSTLSPLLQALWFAGNDDWDAAHTLAQDVATAEGSWVHAYLHRVEGDLGNASYWYHHAGKPVPKVSLQEEWGNIVQALLA